MFTGMLRRALLFVAAAALAAACSTPVKPSDAPAPAIGLYELRIYSAAPGKMDRLESRFRDHTVELFKRHGMTSIAYWRVTGPGVEQPDKLYYLMGYKDRAARDASWKAFASDPQWKSVYAASQKDGSLTSAIENHFLLPAEYSPKLSLSRSSPPRVFELRTYTAAPGKLEAIHARFRDHTRRIFEKHGMTNVLYWRPAPGQDKLAGKMVYLLAFPSVEARNSAWAKFASDPDWLRISAESQKDGPLLKGRPESVLLAPTDYSPLR